MAGGLKRRAFLEKSLGFPTFAAAMSIEEKILFASAGKVSPAAIDSRSPAVVPVGRIGDITVSRLICGGNLFDGFAHSRKLTYVSSLMKHYFTPEKIMDTLELCEANGVNTAILLCWDHTIDVLERYRRERGGKIQWIAQSFDRIGQLECVRMAADHGAVGFFIQGANCDSFISEGKVDFVAEILETARSSGMIAGAGSHTLNVPGTLEQTNIEFDFYFKTINSVDYWSESPEEVASFMKTVEKPWIGFKVLGAGMVNPAEGFELAYRMGADFLNVGMFDFQVADDAALAAEILSSNLGRERPWRS